MKKILSLLAVIVAITVLILSCDTRKFGEKAPIPNVIVDSIAFDLVNDVDTIKTFLQSFGGYTWRFRCFDKNKVLLPTVNLPSSIHYITETGRQELNLKNLNDTTLKSDTYYSIKYFPVATKNAEHKFLINLSNGYGKNFKDTVKFWVEAYQSVGFSYTISPKTFSSIRTDASVNFTLNLISSDINNVMKYYISFENPTNVINSQYGIYKGGTKINSGDELTKGNNSLSLKLTGHPSGQNFKLPIKITDANGDFKLDTITYNCNGNQAPVISGASTAYTQGTPNYTWGNLVDGTATTCTSTSAPSYYLPNGSYSKGISPNYKTYAYRDKTINLTNNLTINVTDDGVNGTGSIKITTLKVSYPNGAVTTQAINGASTINVGNIANGQIVFRYLNNAPYVVPIETNISYRTTCFTNYDNQGGTDGVSLTDFCARVWGPTYTSNKSLFNVYDNFNDYVSLYTKRTVLIPPNSNLGQSAYNDCHMEQTSPFIYMINDGNYQVIESAVLFKPGENITIAVQDSEGLWSADYILTIPSYGTANTTTKLPW